MRTKRFIAGAGIALTALTFVAGCGADQIKQLEPKLELRTAAQHLADAHQAGFTLKLTGSTDDLLTALQSDNATDSAGDKLTDDDLKTLKLLFNSSVTLAYDHAGTGTDDDRMLAAATVDGVTGTELRIVDKAVYVKAPVSELATKFGISADELAETRDAFTAELPGSDPLFDGKWVSVDTDAATALGSAGLGVTTDSLDTAKTITELKTSVNNLLDGASIVRDSADPKHLIVTSSTTQAYQEAKRLSTALGDQLGSGLGEDLTSELTDVPAHEPVVLDLWVADGKLTAIELDLIQFVDGATGRAALHVDVTTGAAITAPADATPVNLSAFTSGLSALEDGTSNISAGEMDDVTSGVGETLNPAARLADEIGQQAKITAILAEGAPADYLKQAIADSGQADAVTIVRRGTAEVITGDSIACLMLADDSADDAMVTAGGC